MESLLVMLVPLVLLILALVVFQKQLKKMGLGKLLPGIGLGILVFLGGIAFLVWRWLRKKP